MSYVTLTSYDDEAPLVLGPFASLRLHIGAGDSIALRGCDAAGAETTLATYLPPFGDFVHALAAPGSSITIREVIISDAPAQSVSRAA